MEQRFIDRVVVTTGAAGGIGKAVAKRFYDEGAKVVMLDLRKEWVDAAAAELALDPERVLALGLDITDEDSGREGVDQVLERWGRSDVLNNLAGGGGEQGPMEDKPMDEWMSVYDINVF